MTRIIKFSELKPSDMVNAFFKNYAPTKSNFPNEQDEDQLSS